VNPLRLCYPLSTARQREPRARTCVTTDGVDLVVVVSGGAGAIGGAIPARFAREGTTVARAGVASVRAAAAARLIQAETGMEVASRPCDVASDSDNRGLVARTAERHGLIDQLVNTAAVNQRSGYGDGGAQEWESITAVNLWGPASPFQAAACSGRRLAEVTL